MTRQGISEPKPDYIWFEGAPHSWGRARLKYAAPLRRERASGPHQGLPYIGLEDIESWTGKVRGWATSERGSQSDLFEPGDVLLGKLRPYLAKAVRADRRGRCTGELLVLRPSRLTQGYLFYMLLSPRFVDVLSSATFGSKMPRAEWSFIGDLLVPVPPLVEQRAITEFLDGHTKTVDEVIAVKKRVVELLEEERQTTIFHLVTQGSGGPAPVQPSDIEWLPEIPSHWASVRLKHAFREVGQRVENSDLPRLSMSQKHGLIPTDELGDGEGPTLRGATNTGRLCEEGDLVLNRLKAHLGVFALAPQTGVVSSDYTVLKPLLPNSGPYFEYLLRTPPMRPVLKSRTRGIVEGFWRLYTDDFGEIRVPLPPERERCEIVAAIKNHTSTTNLSISTAERQIELLEEYRTVLIADAVTGKLDLPAADSRTPDTVAEEAVGAAASGETP